ncbi:MAG: quinolinate synthase [Nitrospinae bacterium RIFCSPLOWO2_12_FULL_47_7]|nr:MAG: quinolinate synthase [Nitrospinae bacterium RIFCSPLOWO2_12_FULL_47_7]
MLTSGQLYDKLKNIRVGAHMCRFTPERCEALLPIVNLIDELKRKKNAIILAHNYVAPEILYGVADYTGDSYGLSKAALRTNASAIVFSAVRFMAETAKILNPDKIVLNPNPDGGCSLADGITATDVKRLKAEHPGYTFVCYINTNAEVKAECDVCVTSSNVYRVVERIPNDNIYFLPDGLMGQNLIKHLEDKGVRKNIRVYNGTCYVHEEYHPESVDFIRLKNPDVEVLVHPECQPAVVNKADYVGSTTGMLDYVRKSSGQTFFLLTECGLTGILQSEYPDKSFVGACTLCKYMKSNTLEDILRVLVNPAPEDIINIDPQIQQKALQCIERMFEYAE